VWQERVAILGRLPAVDGLGARPAQQSDDLEAAREGDSAAFGRLVEPYRVELHAHCYRMLGSVQDAEDALQDALLGAWRGLAGFEGRSSLRSWLYRIATNSCLRLSARRPRRVLAAEHGPATTGVDELGTPVTESVWVEPYPDTELGLAGASADPAARYELRESVELAFVATLQHLPATQRAVLILRDVLGFPATEVAGCLDTTVASVNSALQRARQTLDRRLEPVSQQATLRSLGEAGRRELVKAFVTAWESADVDGLVGMLADDARFAMPPLPAWFDGRADIRRFVAERMFATPWRLVPMTASGQLAFACYQGDEDGSPFRLGAINVLTLRGRQVVEMTGFLDPAVHRSFHLTS
jgi:RNA polymerase sigma-70 factor (ECF subfamily)